MLEFFNFTNPPFQQMPQNLLSPAPAVTPCAGLNPAVLSYNQNLSGGGGIFGSTNLSANAWAGDPSQPLNVTSVEFHLSGGGIAERVIATGSTGLFSSNPWNASWNTTTVPNGTYTLWAVAFDSAGNSGRSASIPINVKN